MSSMANANNNTQTTQSIDELTHSRIVSMLQRSIPDLPRIITEISEQKNTTSDIELTNIVNDLIIQFRDICSRPMSNYKNNDNKLMILNAEIDYVKDLYIKQSGGLQASIDDLKTKYSNCSRLLDEATKSLYRTNKDLNNLQVIDDRNHHHKDTELQNEIVSLKNDAIKLKNVIAQLQTERTQMEITIGEMKTSLNANGETQIELKTKELQTKELTDLNTLLRIINPESNVTSIDVMLSQIGAYLNSTKSLNATIDKLTRDIMIVSQKHRDSNEKLSNCLQNEGNLLSQQSSLQEKLTELNDEKSLLQNNNTSTLKLYNDLKTLYIELTDRVTKIINDYRSIGKNDDPNSQTFLFNLLTVLYDKEVSFARPEDIIALNKANDNDNVLSDTDDANNNDDISDYEDPLYSEIPRTPGSNIENLHEITMLSTLPTPSQSERSSPELTVPLTPRPQTITPPSPSLTSLTTQRKRKIPRSDATDYLMGRNDDDTFDNTCGILNNSNKRAKSPDQT
ncbi:DiNV CH01M ORF4-like protein [Mauternbach virus]|uniref:DiNV CH01M ORF4-like protein n=1 Tax=Mauternbach virus TaxID=2486603 RepID=A0A3G3E620_9VIRU|nr:DiNV CH01M ORF4-like protein [Mauternbach virus]AYP97912.1 DiNV CH01M ORF4-like protein [Mauternbach virus]